MLAVHRCGRQAHDADGAGLPLDLAGQRVRRCYGSLVRCRRFEVNVEVTVLLFQVEAGHRRRRFRQGSPRSAGRTSSHATGRPRRCFRACPRPGARRRAGSFPQSTKLPIGIRERNVNLTDVQCMQRLLLQVCHRAELVPFRVAHGTRLPWVWADRKYSKVWPLAPFFTIPDGSPWAPNDSGSTPSPLRPAPQEVPEHEVRYSRRGGMSRIKAPNGKVEDHGQRDPEQIRDVSVPRSTFFRERAGNW